MSLEEAVKYVAAAYAVILVAVIGYIIALARRVELIDRQVQLLDELLDRRRGQE